MLMGNKPERLEK